MIPTITGNRSATSWAKHVHSLFGLKMTDPEQDDDGVTLDDTPFIVQGKVTEGEDEVAETFDNDWRLDARSKIPLGKTRLVIRPRPRGRDKTERWMLHSDSHQESSTGSEFKHPAVNPDPKVMNSNSESGHLSSGKNTGDNSVGGRYGISFALDSGGGGSSGGSQPWWSRTADSIDPMLFETRSNTTDWVNETFMNWKADTQLLNVNTSLTACSRNMSLDESGSCLPEGLVVTPQSLALCLLLLFFAVSTIFGNGLVIVAVARERYLHTVTNYFIMSLAVADCLVGALVMPFSALYESFDYWLFGPDFCDVWRSFDVLASTASILNLCVISLDRYWAITDPFSYPSRMSPRRARILIAVVWVCSALISFPAIAWWRAVSDPHPPGACPFTEDLSYLVFSSTISFYGPLLVMVFTYFRIYRAATEQTRSLKLGQKLVSSLGDGEMELTLRIHRGGCGGGTSGSTSSNGTGVHRAQYPAGKTYSVTQENGGMREIQAVSSPLEDGESCPLGPMHEGAASPNSSTKVVSRNLKNFSISRKLCKFAKEKKAAKTLGIVMGVFIVCWLPFFVTNLLSGLCGERCITTPELVEGVVTWLGWINSAMNPVIYACWARDFRRAFTRILCSCCPRRCRRRYQTRWKGGIAQGRRSSSLPSSQRSVHPSSSHPGSLRH